MSLVKSNDFRTVTDDFEEVGEECIYRFYDAKYNEKYKNWMVYGGCTFEWRRALEAKFRMY